MGPTPLVERERELDLIASALQRARQGDGQLVLIEGDPGIGKSRLLAAARSLAEDRDVPVLAARAAELERELPFELARQLLGPSIEPPPAELAIGVDRGFDLMNRFRDALVGRLYPSRTPAMKPAVILVDDAQWADQSSLRVLAHLALRIHDLPLLMIVAIRSGENAGDESLNALRAGPRAQRVVLEELSAAGVGRLVSAACGDASDAEIVAACYRASGGNPFYVVELLGELTRSGTVTVEAISDAAPGNVLAAIMARLGRAGSRASALASAVAVLEPAPSLSIAAELAELELREAEVLADELVQAHILAPDERARFAHPLIASTLRSEIGPYARARMHRRAADLLAASGTGDDRVAAHLLQAPAEGDAETVERLRRAAALARARGEPATAARFLKRALAEPPGNSLRGEVLLALGEVEAMSGSPDSLDSLEAALAAVTPARRAEASLALARTLHHAGHFARAAELADDRRRELAADDPRQQALLGAWLSSSLLHAPFRERIPGELAEITAEARRGRLPADPTLSALLAAWLNATDEAPDLLRALAEHAFQWDPLVDGDSRGAALGYAAAVLVYVDALEPAERLIDAAIEAGSERGTAIAVAIARHFLAQVHLHTGRLDDAVTEAELSLEVYRHGWADSAWSTPTLTRTHLERGDLTAAAEAIAIGEAADPSGAERALVLESRAALRLAQGEPAAALEDARAAGAVSDQTFGIKSSRLFDWVRLAAISAQASGESDEALGLATEAVDRARAGAVPRQLGLALTSYGTIVAGEAGIAPLREAVDRLAGSPSRLERAHARLALGRLLRRTGKRSAARDELYGALELADAMGAGPIAVGAREELRALGLRPRRAARSGVESLTPSELRVAKLVARGMRTRQVAEDLYVTRKTVESHLTQIYRKLGINRRGELAAALAGGAHDSTTERSAV